MLTVEQMLDALMNEVVIGKVHLAIGSGLQKADPVVLATAQVFFGFTRAAHLEAAQLYAARLFDKTSGTVTMLLLLKRLEKKPGALKNGNPADLRRVICEAELKIRGLKTPLNAIMLRRNEWLAHTDPQTIINPGRLDQEAALTNPDIETIFGVAAEILNEIASLVSGVTTWPNLLDDDDYEHAMKLIADAKCAEVRAFEAEFGAPAPFPRPRGCT